jgi:ferredoxin
VALGFVLLVGAGLMVRTFSFLSERGTGLDASHTALTTVTLPSLRYTDANAQRAFFRDALQGMRALPGVTEAGASSIIPMCQCNSTTSFQIEGAVPFPQGEEPDVGERIITPGYLESLSIPMAQGRAFALHYSGRSRAQLAFVDELQSLLGPRLHVHADDEPASKLSIEALLTAADPQQPIYVCGPAGMIDATLQIAERLGWPKSALHYELFSEAQPLAGDQPFEVEIRSSGRVLTVPADRSVLDTLNDAGADVMYDCRSGYCGLCSTRVCSGDIEHRDTYLSDAEKASGHVMQVCVSRARSGRLVLDL